MCNIKTSLNEAQQSLANTLSLPVAEARIEAQALLSFVLGNVSRAWLITHENDALEAPIHAEFEALLKRRLAGEPIAYILGHREFYGLELSVTPDTLIPRPDTETLVEAALAKNPTNKPCKILDLGTGTGAIALAIASQRPQAKVTAIDQSAEALTVAISNAQKLKISNVSFLQSDWFSALVDTKFDIIVSNPPYIAQGDPHLSQGDLRFEPISALASGQDGLDDIRRIIQHAPEHLKPQGWLMLEHGFDQAERVTTLMQQAGFGDIEHRYDLADITRVTLGRIE